VRIYQYDGTQWNQIGADIDGAASGDYSGWSVSLSNDGKTVAIGSPEHDDETDEGAGFVRIYKLNTL
jgi:surfactin synthase thioesterase subunit